MLSGIQHFAFCPRQWALIHVEGQWNDNLKTVEGNNFMAKIEDVNRWSLMMLCGEKSNTLQKKCTVMQVRDILQK